MSARIDEHTPLEMIAGIVSEALRDAGIEAVLSGGAAVVIYTDGEIESWDLDFVAHASDRQLEGVMEGLGFRRTRGRYFAHAASPFFIEFPTPPLTIGDQPIRNWSRRDSPAGTIEILTPTQVVMDRLAAWYHWNDRQSLEQAVAVALHQQIDFNEVRDWSEREGIHMKYETFLKRYQQHQ